LEKITSAETAVTLKVGGSYDLWGPESNAKSRVSLRGREVPKLEIDMGAATLVRTYKTHSNVAARPSVCYLPDGRFKEAI
jgi:hypothetical protein